MAHRLAWVLAHGENPPADKQIDHINKKRDDNRLSNLRLASGTENRINGRLSPRNSTGMRGVYPMRGRYAARIKCLDGRRHFLGSFDTPEQAHHAYMKAAKALHGEFASDGLS
jgi:hypothetical protein